MGAGQARGSSGSRKLRAVVKSGGCGGGDGGGRRGRGGVCVLQDDTAVTLPGLLSVSLTWEHTHTHTLIIKGQGSRLTLHFCGP